MKRSAILLCLAMLPLCATRVEAQFGIGCKLSTGSNTQPVALAADTNHNSIWVSLFQSQSVVEVDRNTCNAVRFVSSGGTNPDGIAYDGTYIWVANNGSNSIAKINAGTGALVGTFGTGVAPRGVVWDGTSIWVANYGSNTVSKINPATGGIILNAPTGSGPYFMAVGLSGEIWIANRNSNSITVVAPSGALVRTIFTAGEPQFVAMNGNIWVTCYSAGKIQEFSAQTGALILSVNSPDGGPTGISVGEAGIFVATNSGYVFGIRSDGSTFGNTNIGGDHIGILGEPGDTFVWTANTGKGFIERLQ
jgi:YVTN family beta-propeller protein